MRSTAYEMKNLEKGKFPTWEEIMKTVREQKQHEQQYINECYAEDMDKPYESGCDPWDM